MKIEDNEDGGTSVILEEGDDLASVPDSHAYLITPQLREAFSDPVGRFCKIAECCPFPEMARWLRTLLETPRWQLELNQGDPQEYASAGYYWASQYVRSATIDLPGGTLPKFPKTLVDYYSLVDAVDWMGFGCAGGLAGAGGHAPLRAFPYDWQDIDADEVSVWGYSPCGDMIIWTADGRGGWLSHETGRMQLLGTIEELIDWVYAKLSANECPEYDREWA